MNPTSLPAQTTPFVLLYRIPNTPEGYSGPIEQIWLVSRQRFDDFSIGQDQFRSSHGAVEETMLE
jgi:hypothetical protein